MTVQIRQLATHDTNFDAAFQQVLHWSEATDHAIEQRVGEIIADVRARGDAAVLEYTEHEVDGTPLDDASHVVVRARRVVGDAQEPRAPFA
ncbi:MAG: hypothetical protein ACM32J_08565, partial [Rhizobacter sp.]